MYSAKYVPQSGRTFRFGYEYGTIFDIDPLDGITAKISTSQGFQQTGETVEAMSVSGVERQITGRIIGPANTIKRDMSTAFAPMSYGRLYFEDKYFCDCVVKSSPAFGVETRDCAFTITLFCPFPYWMDEMEENFISGGYTPTFHFPINYATPHMFGIANPTAFINCYNDGVVPVDFTAVFTARVPVSSYYGIINALTGQELRINDSLALGEKTKVYRKNGRMYVEKNGKDIFEKLDEDSTLFTMAPRDNPIKAITDNSPDDIIVTISFYNTYSEVYDGM